MKNQFRIINRTTEQEQVFNSDELKRFFYCEYDHQTQKVKYNNKYKDYTVSLEKTDTEKILSFINYTAIIGTSLYILSQWI
tara:strand:+ start:307 stop:549 length:243 start_codon:yes stop_codon:yes gene_type:complete